MKKSDFGVLILTHGRPEKVITYEMLRKQGYSGRIVLVVDDGDASLPEYQDRYGDEVSVFSKEEVAGTFDIGDNFGGTNVVVFARNVCHEIAKGLGLTHFLVLDDDYTQMIFRFNERYEWTTADVRARNLDRVFKAFARFLDSTTAITVTMAQGGDFIGGADGSFGSIITLRRKAMNSFFCRTDRPFQFPGRINEDANAYAVLAAIGKLLFTHNFIALSQVQTQKSEGGLTEFYLEKGTYVKSFYTVMMHPSGARVRLMQVDNPRLHHSIAWNNTTPMILRETVKK